MRILGIEPYGIFLSVMVGMIPIMIIGSVSGAIDCSTTEGILGEDYTDEELAKYEEKRKEPIADTIAYCTSVGQFMEYSAYVMGVALTVTAYSGIRAETKMNDKKESNKGAVKN